MLRDPCLALLQRQISGLHVGGKAALDWHGVRHYVAQEPRLLLYGLKSAKLPAWFTDAFPAEHHRKQIFSSDAVVMQNAGNMKYASVPSNAERARKSLHRSARSWSC